MSSIKPENISVTYSNTESKTHDKQPVMLTTQWSCPTDS